MGTQQPRVHAISLLLLCSIVALHAQTPPPVQNASGLRLLVADENTQPTLRIVLPGHPDSDRSIEVIFPEHVTVRKRAAPTPSSCIFSVPDA